jgi:hypothetical protein
MAYRTRVAAGPRNVTNLYGHSLKIGSPENLPVQHDITGAFGCEDYSPVLIPEKSMILVRHTKPTCACDCSTARGVVFPGIRLFSYA